MEIAIIVIFGAVFFGFGLLFLAIKIWQKLRGGGNSKRHFSQSSGAAGTTLIAEDNDSDTEDFTDYSSIDYLSTNSEKMTEANAELTGDLEAVTSDGLNPPTDEIANSQTESSWSYNSTESSSSYTDSSSSGDSSSSCSSSSSSD